MKFIAFWEFKPEDMDKVIEKNKQAKAEREKGSEKFPKLLFPPHSMIGQWKGFSIYDECYSRATDKRGSFLSTRTEGQIRAYI